MRLLWWLSFRLESWALALQNWLASREPPGPRLSGLKLDTNATPGRGLEAWAPDDADYVIELWPQRGTAPADRVARVMELLHPEDEDGNPMPPFIDEATALRLLDKEDP